MNLDEHAKRAGEIKAASVHAYAIAADLDQINLGSGGISWRMTNVIHVPRSPAVAPGYAWLDLDPDDEAAWDEPEFVKRVNGAPGLVNFTDWRTT